ncbi:MAG: hypothetical protein LBD76_05350 [Prevotellaceae bacterium]|jgi:hypothetical protein|nr:hypothetical protein [Prevotellaceae bacterium]
MYKFLYKISTHIVAAFLLPYYYIRRRCFAQYEFVRACKLANKLHEATGYRYYVLFSDGRYVIKPKRVIKSYLKTPGKYFKKGTKIGDIEKIALYITRGKSGGKSGVSPI